jgi:two-component system, NtrC family, sensor kinase
MSQSRVGTLQGSPSFVMRKFWRRLNLSQKIVIPFLAIFLLAFLLSLFTVGHWLSNSLEQNLSKEVENFSERIYQDFQYQQETLDSQAKLLTERDAVRLALEKSDRNLLLKNLLPLRATLELDWIKVINRQGNMLLDLRSIELLPYQFVDESIVETAKSGADYVDLVTTTQGTETLRVVIHPIKSTAGLLGSLIIGQAIDDELLQTVVKGSSKHLMITKGDDLIATTLPTIRSMAQQGKKLEVHWSNLPTDRTVAVAIAQQPYLIRKIILPDTNQTLAIVVAQLITELQTNQYWLWVQLGGIFLLGSSVTVAVGIFIAQAITRPLTIVSQVAQQVTQDSQFDLQAPIITQDEVGVVAMSLNQLIQKVQQLLKEQAAAQEKLTFYNQTLEQNVIQRTQELQQKNIDLQSTLQKLQTTQMQLVQSEKMSAHGQLVAGIAHELNNPISFIYGNLEYADRYSQTLLQLIHLYQQHIPQPAPEIQQALAQSDLDYIQQDFPRLIQSMHLGSDRIRNIVLSLRTFSRLDESNHKLADLHEGLESTLLILQHRLNSTRQRPAIQIIKAYGEIPEIQCWAGQMNQVFMNILSNAIDALEEAYKQGHCVSPQISISTQHIQQPSEPLAPPQSKLNQTQNPNPHQIVITIADNGIGMSDEVRQRVFDPFFTTKPIGKGTGLGLSSSYQIITKTHAGSLHCRSIWQQGTEFVITLPIQSA